MNAIKSYRGLSPKLEKFGNYIEYVIIVEKI